MADPPPEQAPPAPTRPDHHGTGVEHPEQKPAKRRGPAARLLRLLGLFLVVLVPIVLVLALLAPTLLSTDGGTRILVNAVNEQIPGTITVDDLSLSWFGGQSVTGVTYTDAVRGIDLTVAQIDADELGLFALLRGSRRVGEIRLNDVELVYNQPERTARQPSKTEPQVVEEAAPFSLPPSLAGSVVIEGLSVRYAAAGLEPVLVELPQGELVVTDLRDIGFDFDASLRQGEKTGRLLLTGQLLNLFDPEGVIQPMEAGYTAEAQVRGLPTDALDRFLAGNLGDGTSGFFAKPGRLAALLGGGEVNAEAHIDGMIRQLSADWEVTSPNVLLAFALERDGDTLIASPASRASLDLTPDAFDALLPDSELTLDDTATIRMSGLQMRLPFEDSGFDLDAASVSIVFSTDEDNALALRSAEDEVLWVDALTIAGGGESIARELGFDLSATLSAVDQQGEVTRETFAAELKVIQPLDPQRSIDFYSEALPIMLADALGGMDGRLVLWLGEVLALEAEMQGRVRTGPSGQPLITRRFALRPNGRVLGEVSGEVGPGKLIFETGVNQPLEAQLVPEAFASLMTMLSNDPDRPMLTIDQPMDVRILLRQGERPNAIVTDLSRQGVDRFFPVPDQTYLGAVIELTPARVYDPAMETYYQLRGGTLSLSAEDPRSVDIAAELQLFVTPYEGADGVAALFSWQTTATQVLGSDGGIPTDPALLMQQVALDGGIELSNAPAGLFDSLLQRDGDLVSILGPVVEQLQADFTYSDGRPTGASVRLNWDEQNNSPIPGAQASMRPAEFDIDEQGILTVRGGQDLELQVQVTEAFGDRWMGQLHPFLFDAKSGDRPVSITIDGGSFRFPLSSDSMAGANVEATVDLGSVEFGDNALMAQVLGWTGHAGDRAIFDPARVSLVDGRIAYEGFGMAIGNVSLRLDGEVDLVSGEIVDMAVRVPGESLIRVFNDLEGVIPADDYLNIPMTGPIRRPSFDSERIPREVARLLTQNLIDQQRLRLENEVRDAVLEGFGLDGLRLPRRDEPQGEEAAPGDEQAEAPQPANPSPEQVIVESALDLIFGRPSNND